MPFDQLCEGGRPPRAAEAHSHPSGRRHGYPLEAPVRRPQSGRSGLVEDFVGSDPAPDDVRLALADRIAVLEGCSTVIRPGHLEDARSTLDTLDTLDPKSLAETFASAEILNELCDGGQE